MTLTRRHVQSTEDAEDVIQDAVVSAVRGSGSYRGPIRDDRNFEGWFRRIVVNCCHRLNRSRRRRLKTGPVVHFSLEAVTSMREGWGNPVGFTREALMIEKRQQESATSTESEVIRRVDGCDIANDLLHNAICQAVGDLPECDREIFADVYFRGFTISDAARMNGSTVRNVEAVLHRSRESVRCSLGIPASGSGGGGRRGTSVRFDGRGDSGNGVDLHHVQPSFSDILFGDLAPAPPARVS